MGEVLQVEQPRICPDALDWNLHKTLGKAHLFSDEISHNLEDLQALAYSKIHRAFKIAHNVGLFLVYLAHQFGKRPLGALVIVGDKHVLDRLLMRSDLLLSNVYGIVAFNQGCPRRFLFRMSVRYCQA